MISLAFKNSSQSLPYGLHHDQETTDMALFVRTSREEVVRWDRAYIVQALVRETGLDRPTAEKISLEVEEQIKISQTKTITAPLIREMANAKLIEHGYENARRLHTRLGVPLYDAEQLITNPNRENANVPHSPEGTNLTLAEAIKKEYALLAVFDQETSDAHLRGDIHIHDLGFIDRPYCSGQSLEYVKKYGLNLPNALSLAKPAKHPEVLLAHMVKFAAALQGHFAGAIGWDAVNLFFAPYLEKLSSAEVEQMAQMLVFEFSQQAVARGGQAIFSDINIYWEVPKHFEDVPAIGPGGQYTGKTYSYYAEKAKEFAWALFEVYLQGDGAGRPFFFPKPLVHLTDKFFRTSRHKDFLQLICQVASEKGNTYFVFDRGDTAKISQCCRLSFKLEPEDFEDAKQPWRMRYCALQNVTVNLPRVAYLAKGSDAKLFEILDKFILQCAAVHKAKHALIQKLLDLRLTGPLALLAMKPDGLPYLRMSRANHLIGMVGLNEMVQYHTGQQLHESDEALRFGLKVIAFMNLACQKLAKKYKVRFVLEQTPAESTAYRFAKLDLKLFPEEALQTVKGNLAKAEVFYTNSTLFNVSATVDPIERVKKEGLFHPLITAGSISHIWLGEQNPDKDALASFVSKTFYYTQNDQIAFSPEFTTCNDCGFISRGLYSRCPRCHSNYMQGVNRIDKIPCEAHPWEEPRLWGSPKPEAEKPQLF